MIGKHPQHQDMGWRNHGLVQILSFCLATAVLAAYNYNRTMAGGGGFNDLDQRHSGEANEEVVSHNKGNEDPVKWSHLAVNWEDLTKDPSDGIIRTFLHHRKQGLSIEEIAQSVFKVPLPHANETYQHSYPFLSGDTLRAFADVVVEDRIIKPWKFRDGDVIYAKSDYATFFARHIFPKMSTKFILVTHNSDLFMPPKHHFRIRTMLESDLLIKWFTLNPEPEYALHPKIHAIPIGLENRWYNSSGDIYRVENYLSDIPPIYSSETGEDGTSSRDILVYVNFNYDTNPARKLFAKFFKKVATFQKKGSMDGYLSDLKRSKFVLSPPGNGLDCHRTYESILLGAIPIVLDYSGALTRDVYSSSPTYVISKQAWWKRRKAVTEEELLAFAVDPRGGRRVVMAQYWFDKFDKLREEYRRRT